MPAKPLTAEQQRDAERLKALFVEWQTRRKAERLPSSQEAAAELLGFNQSSTSQYLSGRIPLNLAAAGKFAHLLGCRIRDVSPSIAELAHQAFGSAFTDGVGSMPGSVAVEALDDDAADVVTVPLVKLRLSAGIMGFAGEPESGISRNIRMDRLWLEQNGFELSKLIAVRVKGESMEPALYDGDIVVINTADRKPVDGGVFAVNFEGEPVIKRLTRDMGRWWLTSDNVDQRKFSRKSCDGDHCILVGRVVHLNRDGMRI